MTRSNFSYAALFRPALFSGGLLLVFLPFFTLWASLELRPNAQAQLQAQVPDIPDTLRTEQLSPGQLAAGQRLFVQGIMEFEFGNYDYAAELLAEAGDKIGEHGSASVDFSLAEVFMELEDSGNALYYAERAVEKEGENKWYRIKLAEVYRDQGRSAESIAQLEEALRIAPQDVDVLYTIARVYTLEGQLEKANETYSRIIQYTGTNLQVLYQKYRNYERMGEPELAIEQLEAMLEIDAGNEAALQTLSQMYKREGEVEKAIDILYRAYRLNPDNEETLITLSDLYISEGRWEEATGLLSRMIQNPTVESYTKMELVQYMYSRLSRNPGDTQLQEATHELMSLLLEEAPEFGYARALAAEYYGFIGEEEKQLENLAKTNAYFPDNEAAWRQRMQLLLVNDRFEEVLEVGREADEVIPDDAFVLFFMGNAHLLQDEHEEAIGVLERAASAPANREFRSAVYGTLGDAFSSLDRWEEADQAYERALRMNADNDVVLNNFAYYLSQREMDLDRAKEMAEQALEKEPENAAYLDTYGWIFYKLGDYAKARQYIEKSIDTGNASATVYEHLGDVHSAKGNEAEAIKWWQQALDKDESKTHLSDKIQSIE